MTRGSQSHSVDTCTNCEPASGTCLEFSMPEFSHSVAVQLAALAAFTNTLKAYTGVGMLVCGDGCASRDPQGIHDTGVGMLVCGEGCASREIACSPGCGHIYFCTVLYKST